MSERELGRKYMSGETICLEGEEGKNMFVIQSGSVEVIKKTPDGEIRLTTLKKGEIFGEMALFDRLPRSATVKAVGEAVVLCIDKKGFFTKVSKDPTLAFHIIEGMSRRIRALNEDLAKFRKKKGSLPHMFTDINLTVKLVLDEVKHSIQAENGSVMLLDEKEQMLNIVAAFGGNSEKKTEMRVGDGIAGDVVRTGRIELINSISEDSRFKPGHMNFNTLMCAPLKTREKVFGVINLSNSSDRVFNLDDMKCLRVLSNYGSIAIENAKLFAETSKVRDAVLKHATLLDI